VARGIVVQWPSKSLTGDQIGNRQSSSSTNAMEEGSLQDLCIKRSEEILLRTTLPVRSQLSYMFSMAANGQLSIQVHLPFHARPVGRL
jgi:hypothetical protein